MPPLRILALVFLLPACTSWTDWADRNGPVIGDRCEHWQCITDSGQQRSNMIQQQRLMQQQAQ